MRQIVLDTETTGLEPTEGHRIIEIGCVEILNRRVTNKHFHQYLRPDRDIDAGAQAVHGISNEFLQDKPVFGAIAEEFLSFVKGAELIIHNAPFDVGFIDAELARLGAAHGKLTDFCRITDTLALARRMHPGQKNNLDALCKRYNVDNSHRDRHGALLDAEILADVYLAMTGGQSSLVLDHSMALQSTERTNATRVRADRPRLPVIRANLDESAAHTNMLARLDKTSGGKCVWKEE